MVLAIMPMEGRATMSTKASTDSRKAAFSLGMCKFFAKLLRNTRGANRPKNRIKLPRIYSKKPRCLNRLKSMKLFSRQMKKQPSHPVNQQLKLKLKKQLKIINKRKKKSPQALKSLKKFPRKVNYSFTTKYI